MKKRFGLTTLRFKKVGELMKSQLGVYRLRKNGEIRYGRTLIGFVFRPRRTSFLEFCITDLPLIFKISVKSNYTIDNIIDMAYSNFILGEYNMSDLDADFKFNTIRNIFRDSFRSKEYMINHYSNKLSLPIIQYLKKELSDRDILNIVIPARISIMTVVREFENGIIDHVRKEFNLMRAGPYNVRSPLTLVA